MTERQYQEDLKLKEFLRGEHVDTDEIKYGYFGVPHSQIAEELGCNVEDIEAVACGGIRIKKK